MREGTLRDRSFFYLTFFTLDTEYLGSWPKYTVQCSELFLAYSKMDFLLKSKRSCETEAEPNAATNAGLKNQRAGGAQMILLDNI